MRSPKIGNIIIVLSALSLIAFRAPSGDQSGLFGSIVKQYVEETSASVVTASASQLADISDLETSQGAQASIAPQTIGNTAIVAVDPTSTDYIQELKPDKVTDYTVQAGDNVSFIASDFGVSVDSILWANNLKSPDNISPGDILHIPPVSGVIYTVEKGDTLSSIADKFSADANKIASFNSLFENSLVVGQQIIVPDGTPSGSASEGETPTVVSTASRFAYLTDLGSYFIIPTTGYDWGIIHDRNGVDIANSCGTPIHAAAAGVVGTAITGGWNGGYGNYIKISHPNGTETLYAHMTKLLVNVGESVTQGETIGLMGTTGNSTGCHLHFEVHGAKNPLANFPGKWL